MRPIVELAFRKVTENRSGTGWFADAAFDLAGRACGTGAGAVAGAVVGETWCRG